VTGEAGINVRIMQLNVEGLSAVLHKEAVTSDVQVSHCIIESLDETMGHVNI